MQNLVFRKFAIMLGISKLGHISEISDISCVVRFREGTGEILLNFSWQYALTNPVNSSKILQSFRKSMNQSQTDLPLQHLSCTYIFTSLHPALSGFIMGEVSYPTIFAVH